MNIDRAEEEALVALVRRTARRKILPRFRDLSPEAVRAKSRRDDLVTDADLAAESMIAREAAEILPGAVIVGEEGVAEDESLLDRLDEPGTALIVDPIDGTWNYANGLATFGTLLAVTVDGETVFGMLHDPLCDDWLIARLGGGAWYCRDGVEPVRLAVSDTQRCEDLTGYLSVQHFHPEHRAALLEATLAVDRVESLRCSCHEYRMLAQGRVDFSISGGNNAWDHAAGMLAVREAGGASGLLDGRDYAPRRRDGHPLAANSAWALEWLRERFGAALAR